MDLDGDQCHNDLSDDGWNFSSYYSCQLFQLVDNDIQMGFYSLAGVCVFFDGLLSIECPDNLGSDCYDLTGLSHDPISLFLILAVHPFVETNADDSADRVIHFLLQVAKPNLHSVLCLHHSLEHYSFLLGAEHAFDEISLGKTLAVHHVKLHQSFEALAEVLLHHFQAASFRKYFQQLIIREEIEPREDLSLAFKVLLQLLFDFLQGFHSFIKFFEQIGHFGQFDDLGAAQQLLDVPSYKLIAYVKLLGLEWHLGLDIRGHEDIFEIHPLSLCLHPLLHDFHDELDILGEFFSTWLDGLDVAVGESVIDVSQRLI